MRLVLPAAVCLWAFACAHTATNEERLEGITDAQLEPMEDLATLRCRDGAPEIQLARDAAQKKGERLSRFDAAIRNVKATQARFDEVFRKDPDLVYGAQASDWKQRQTFCADLLVALQKERGRLENEAEPAKAEVPATPAAAPAGAPAKAAESSPSPARAQSADEAFSDDADELRSAYKKKSKVAKAKKTAKKKKRVSLATR